MAKLIEWGGCLYRRGVCLNDRRVKEKESDTVGKNEDIVESEGFYFF